ncbi:MAG: hypothetical protein QM784_34065 [Polyangiaceae bacterium]
MRTRRRIELGLIVSMFVPGTGSGCTRSPAREPTASNADYSAIHSGCESIRLYEPHHAVNFHFRVIRTVEGSFVDRSKDLRAWIINEACALGANAVMSISESIDSDEQGLPVYKIRGTAIAFEAPTPNSSTNVSEPRLTAPQPGVTPESTSAVEPSNPPTDLREEPSRANSTP